MKSIIYLSIAIVSFGLYSCKKVVQGCTDQNAENYNFEANEDAGTCSFRGSAVFYHNSQTSQNLTNAGVTSVKLYVDGNFMDLMSPNVGFSFVPSCDHPDAMLMSNYGIGNVPSKTFIYSIRDQNQVVLASGTFEIKGNECTTIEYTY